MRVTKAVREYVHQAILAKVADRIKLAEDASAAVEAARNDKIEKAKKLCEKMCAETQARFAKEVKKTLGLTLIPEIYGYSGSIIGANLVVRADVNRDDFVETLTTRNSIEAKNHPCAARDEYDKIVSGPYRIRSAAAAAADKLLFELELGKVAKGELDELLQSLEVKV